MDHYYFPFGLGSRMCIGKNISIDGDLDTCSEAGKEL